jgi:DNA-binding transcriptional ArsR family regulator
MLDYVPVTFYLYRAVQPRLRWTLQCLVGFADKTGRCFPSVRKLAEVADLSKSTVSRHLAALARTGLISRERRPGGVYRYQIDRRFLPLSHSRTPAVPRARTEEYPTKKKSDSLDALIEVPWTQRVRWWLERKCWLDNWGPKPNEPGCLAPIEVLRATIGHVRPTADRPTARRPLADLCRSGTAPRDLV